MPNSADKYRQQGNDYHWKWWSQGPHNPYRAWVERVLQEFPDNGDGARLLDYGCGDGVPARELVLRGYAVTGIEPLEGPRMVAAERVPDALYLDAYVDGVYDYVLALESVEHMDEAGIAALVRAVMLCERYAIVTSPPAGMDAHAVGAFDTARMAEVFAGCEVKLLHVDEYHQMWKVTPPRKEAAPKPSRSKRKAEPRPEDAE